MRYCKNCGLLTTDPRASHCPKCGAPLPAPISRSAADREDAPHYAPAAEPEEQGPMSLGGYLASLLVYMIPVVGFVVMLIWSLGGTRSEARARLSQAYLIRKLLTGVLVLLIVAVAVVVFVNIAPPLGYYGYYGW